MNETFIESTFMFFLENWLDVFIVLAFILLFISIAYINNVKYTHGEETGFEEKKQEVIFHTSLFYKNQNPVVKKKRAPSAPTFRKVNLADSGTATLSGPVSTSSENEAPESSNLYVSPFDSKFTTAEYTEIIKQLSDKNNLSSHTSDREEFMVARTVNGSNYPYNSNISDRDLIYYKN